MMINRWWKAHVGALIGLGLAINSFGKAIFTPVVANIIIDYGWRTTYKVLGIFGAVVVVIIPLIFIKNTPEDCRLLPTGATLNSTADGNSQATASKALGLDASRAKKTIPFYLALIMSAAISIIMCFQSHETYYSMTTGFAIVQGLAIIATGGISNYFSNLLVGVICDKWGVRAGRWFSGVLAIVSAMFFLLSVFPSYTFLLIVGTLFGASFCLAAVLPIQVREMFGSR